MPRRTFCPAQSVPPSLRRHTGASPLCVARPHGPTAPRPVTVNVCNPRTASGALVLKAVSYHPGQPISNLSPLFHSPAHPSPTPLPPTSPPTHPPTHLPTPSWHGTKAWGASTNDVSTWPTRRRRRAKWDQSSSRRSSKVRSPRATSS